MLTAVYAPGGTGTPYAPGEYPPSRRPPTEVSHLLSRSDRTHCEVSDAVLSVTEEAMIRVALLIPDHRPYVFTVPAEHFATAVVRHYNDFRISRYARMLKEQGMADRAEEYAREIDFALYCLAARLWNISVTIPLRGYDETTEHA